MSVLDARKRIVVKVGSSLLVGEDGTLREAWLDALARDLLALDAEVMVVSSGAVALGRRRLGLSGRLSLAEKQACASAGQSRLTQGYERAFAAHGRVAAQALLTLDDTEVRRRWLNARQTLETLLSLRAIPIINENDTVATDEIRYGDNDRLAARAAQMVGADLLVLLSDIDGLYTTNPRTDTAATHIPLVENLTDAHLDMAGEAGSDVGTGGMATKLLAARIAVEAGCDMVICDGRDPGALSALRDGARHTLFRAKPKRKARANWIAGTLKPSGTLHIDAGAAHALTLGKSLLAVGITHTDGDFAEGDVVSLHGPDGELARGLAGCGAQALAALDDPRGTVVVHRDDLVML